MRSTVKYPRTSLQQECGESGKEKCEEKLWSHIFSWKKLLQKLTQPRLSVSLRPHQSENCVDCTPSKQEPNKNVPGVNTAWSQTQKRRWKFPNLWLFYPQIYFLWSLLSACFSLFLWSCSSLEIFSQHAIPMYNCDQYLPLFPDKFMIFFFSRTANHTNVCISWKPFRQHRQHCSFLLSATRKIECELCAFIAFFFFFPKGSSLPDIADISFYSVWPKNLYL